MICPLFCCVLFVCVLCVLDYPKHRHPIGVARSVSINISLGFYFVCGLCCLSPCLIGFCFVCGLCCLSQCLVFDLNVVGGCVS